MNKLKVWLKAITRSPFNLELNGNREMKKFFLVIAFAAFAAFAALAYVGVMSVVDQQLVKMATKG